MDLSVAIDTIDTLLTGLRERNKQNAPTRSRELSVAITEIETGLLWMREAKRKEDQPF